MVDTSSPVPLYVQIQEVLYEQIRSGELPAGSRIPSEVDLAAQYSVSRMTARKALDELAAKGLIFRQRGKGTFVAEDVMSYGLSTMLSFSGTLRARGYKVDTKVLRQDAVPAPPAVARQLRLKPGGEVVLVRRLRSVGGKSAAIHTSFMDYLVYAPILQTDLSAESLLTSMERILGVRLAYARDSVHAALVSTEDMGLLEIPEGSPVLEVEGVAFTGNGQPTRVTKAVYRADMFRLVVTSTGDRATSLKVVDMPGQAPLD